MRMCRSIALLTSALALLLAGVALGGEGVQIKVTNDGTKAVTVTIYDNNARPRKAVLENQRINGFTSLPISVMGDESGMGNITWTASSTDGVERRCGRADANVVDDATVSVKAEDSCSGASTG